MRSVDELLRDLTEAVGKGSCHSIDADLCRSYEECSLCRLDHISKLRSQLESEYIKLPIDADGVPLHMGDEVMLYGPDTYKVKGISYYEDNTCVTYRSEHGCGTDYASNFHHYHKPTLEDVLMDLVGQVTNGQRIHGAITPEQAIPECIAKIREVMADGRD